MLTQSIENYYNSSKAHQDYLNSIERSMSIGNEYERAKEREKQYQEMIEEYKTQLEEIRKAHCRLTVGETMIRLLRTKNDELDQNMSMAEYAELFTDMAIKAQKVKYKDARFAEIFHSVLEENVYSDSGRKSGISRKNVILMCLSLGWISDDVNYILLRSLDDDGLNYKTVDDLAAMFALDVPGADDSHYRSIRQTLNRRVKAARKAENGKQEEDKKRKKSKEEQPVEFQGTVMMANAFRAIIKKKNLDVDKKKKLYIKTLTEYKEYLNSPSETARQIFARILQFRYAPEDQKQAVTVEKALETWILSTEHPTLTEEDLRKLKSEAVYYGQDSWSVPSVDQSDNAPKLFRTSLLSRVDSILDGTLQVNKKDMLFALFHACAQYWEQDKTTDATVLKSRLSNFKGLCKKVLEDSLLPPFYLPHPLEYTIACSVLSGASVYDTFDELVCNLDTHKAKRPALKKYPKKKTINKSDEDVNTADDYYDQKIDNYESDDDLEEDIIIVEEEREDATGNEKILVLDDGMLDNVYELLRTCANRMRVLHNGLYMQEYRQLMSKLKPIAEAIAKSWERYGFAATNFYFEENEKVGVWPRGEYNWIPYHHIAEMDSDVRDLCWKWSRDASIPVYSKGQWKTVDQLVVDYYIDKKEKEANKKCASGEKGKENSAAKENVTQEFILDATQSFRARRKMMLYYIWNLVRMDLENARLDFPEEEEDKDGQETEELSDIMNIIQDDAKDADEAEQDEAEQDDAEQEKTDKIMEACVHANLILKVSARERVFDTECLSEWLYPQETCITESKIQMDGNSK